MTWWWYLFPLAAACIGWAIASFSLWLLFHPACPINIMGIRIQGIIPARKKVFDGKLSRIIAQEFFSIQEMEETFINKESFQKILPSIEAHLDNFLQNKLHKAIPFLGMFVGDKIMAQLKELFMEELSELFPVVMKNYIGRIQQEIDLESVLYHKLAAIPSERLESLVHELLAREWRSVKIMGALAGLIIGLLQLGLLWLTSH
ncbi:MAG TPA: DUF445 domain-containing protein [Chitinophagaceae bacterium]|nr:DUF445 domain-containing protein [Chitinophagaceae bacterium]